MGFFDSITNGIKGHFDKQAENRKMMEDLQREIDLEKKRIFAEEYRANALEVAKAKAKKEAAQKSGLQKLRSLNRAKRMSENNIVPGSFFDKLSEYTKKNIARREENIKRTQLMRQAAEELKAKREIEKASRLNKSSKSFSNSTWKM